MNCGITVLGSPAETLWRDGSPGRTAIRTVGFRARAPRSPLKNVSSGVSRAIRRNCCSCTHRCFTALSTVLHLPFVSAEIRPRISCRGPDSVPRLHLSWLTWVNDADLIPRIFREPRHRTASDSLWLHMRETDGQDVYADQVVFRLHRKSAPSRIRTYAHGSGGSWPTASLPACIAVRIGGWSTSGPHVRQCRTISLRMIVAVHADLPNRRSTRILPCPRVTVSLHIRLPHRARSGHAHGSGTCISRSGWPIADAPRCQLNPSSYSPARHRPALTQNLVEYGLCGSWRYGRLNLDGTRQAV